MPRKKCPLETAIKQNILPLNNTLPDDLASIWLTSEEFYERLIFAGVDRSLTMPMFHSALKYFNHNQINIAVWKYSGVNYFRSKKANDEDETNEVPLKQRFKWKGGPQNRINCNPPRGYFASHSNGLLTTINDALLKLEQKQGTAVKKKGTIERRESCLCFKMNVA